MCGSGTSTVVGSAHLDKETWVCLFRGVCQQVAGQPPNVSPRKVPQYGGKPHSHTYNSPQMLLRKHALLSITEVWNQNLPRYACGMCYLNAARSALITACRVSYLRVFWSHSSGLLPTALKPSTASISDPKLGTRSFGNMVGLSCERVLNLRMDT